MNDQEASIDSSKILVDWALAAGRILKSEQTGFIHYDGEAKEGLHQLIPVYEN